MIKRAFIIHGWGGSPCGWLLWLKDELEKKGFKVEVPQMPHTETPTITDWVDHLSHIVGTPDEETYFIGHSIGCQTILRYLERLPENVKVGGAVFVAGFFTLKNIEKEDLSIVKPWLEIPINTEKIKKHTEKFVALFSEDDPSVPLENKEIFAERLHAKIIVEQNKGHYTGETNINGNQTALQAILSIS